jgi:prepilin-type N-terminal cleavage/methylation domain-containing protein
MTRLAPVHRSGFTLLEVLLASVLAVVLMAALYVALDVQLRLAADGRDAIEQATLVRAIMHRVEVDFGGTIGPVAPPVGTTGSSAASGGGAGATGAAATGTDTAATGDAVTEAVTQTDTIPFQAGVIGSSDRVTLYVARVAGLDKNQDASGDVPTAADFRRVTYWLTDKGLARQELSWVTSEQVQTTTDPVMEDGKEEANYVIAEEVTKLQVEYWDGSAWTDTWDGRTLNADGKTLKGPPMAIRVRFWLRVPGPERGETIEKEYRHTIAIRSGPGPATPDADAAAALAATSSTPMP